MLEFFRLAFLGLGVGALYALVSQGLVLIYRGSGVLNLALGAIGMVAAYVEWQLVVRSHVPVVLAFAIGVACSAAVGTVVHLVVMRPLRRASPLARLVATLAVLIIIQAVAVIRYSSAVIIVPNLLPTSVWRPFGLAIEIDRVILVGIAGVLSLVCWAVYRYTRAGLATVAAAENERAAASLGWSSNAIAAANWALGSAIAGVAAILIAPIVTLQSSTMTNLVLAAMAAALVAGFRSFPIAFAAGLVIGLVQTEVGVYASANWGQGLDQSVPFFVIVVVLVLSGRAIPLRDYFLQKLPSVGTGRVRPALVVLGLAIMVVLISVTNAEWTAAFTVNFAVALILLSIVVLTGYAGQLSLGQLGLAGFGAWIAAKLVATQGLPFSAALVIGAIGAIPMGLLFALPAIRTRGVNLAIVTLGLGSALELMLFQNPQYVGGYAGIDVGTTRLFGWDVSVVDHPQRYALFALGCFAVIALMVANVRRGRSGRRLLAVRTNERAAAALGVSVYSAKLYAFGLSAAIAAVGGIIMAFSNNIIDFSQFDSFTSITYVGWAFIGGIGYLLGPVIGAQLAVGAVGTQITNVVLSSLDRYIQLIGAVWLLLLVLQNQDGIAKEILNQMGWIGKKLRAGREPVRRVYPLPAERRTRVAPRHLAVDSVKVQYGGVIALDGLSVTVKPGEILGLIGPNGAGKTTAVDAISGFSKLAAGRVMLDGQDVSKLSPVRRARAGISRSFQSLELFEDATVLENLRVAADPRDVLSYFRDLLYPVAPKFPGEVVAAIKEFELEDALDRVVQDLPYGQRRLLALARAVASQPSVLLLDEPASGLSDAESRRLATLVRRLADEWGMAILLIEHDVAFVMSTCDRIVVLDFGRTISEGTPDVVRRDPAVVEAYLGTSEEVEHPDTGVPADGRETGRASTERAI